LCDQRADPASAEEDKKGVVIARRTGFLCRHRRRFRCIYAATHYAHLSPAEFSSGRRGNARCDSLRVVAVADRCCAWCCGSPRTLCIVWMLRARNVPARGGALLTPNHVSMADAVLLIASIDRPIRFIMSRLLRAPAGKTVCKDYGCDSHRVGSRPREMIHSCPGDGRAEKWGDRLHLPEGQMSASADAALPPRHGAHHQSVDVPIIPVISTACGARSSVLPADGFFGSFRGKSLPRASHFWKAAAPTASAQEVRRAVQDLGAEAFARRKKRMTRCPSFIYRRGGTHSASPWPTGKGRS